MAREIKLIKYFFKNVMLAVETTVALWVHGGEAAAEDWEEKHLLLHCVSPEASCPVASVGEGGSPQPCWNHCNCGQMWARTQGMRCWSGEAQPQAMLTKVKVICSPPAPHPVTRLSTVSSSLCPPPHLLPVSHHPAVPDSWKPEHSSEHRDVSLKKSFLFYTGVQPIN